MKLNDSFVIAHATPMKNSSTFVDSTSCEDDDGPFEDNEETQTSRRSYCCTRNPVMILTAVLVSVVIIITGISVALNRNASSSTAKNEDIEQGQDVLVSPITAPSLRRIKDRGYLRCSTIRYEFMEGFVSCRPWYAPLSCVHRQLKPPSYDTSICRVLLILHSARQRQLQYLEV